MTIPTLPTAPQPTDDLVTFNSRSFAFAAALDPWGQAAQAVGDDVASDALATGADRVQTGLDRTQTAADRVQTGLDRTQTAADRVQTGLDRAAAAASAVQASKLNLGNKSTPPTVDNQGDALLAGATYYDTTLNKWRVWTGSAWGDGVSAIAGVSEINGASGAVTIKSVAGQSLVGGGDVVIPASNVQTFTATGTLTDGMVVALRSDGTVEPVVQTTAITESTGTVTTFDASTVAFIKSCAIGSGKIAIVYQYTTFLDYCVIGTVSGTSISFGTPVQVSAVSNGGRPTAIVYDSTNDKVVIAHYEGTARKAVVGTVSGTSISFGTKVTMGTGDFNYLEGCFSTASGKVVFAYTNTSQYPTAIVGTVSGTSISFGSEANANSSGATYICCTYDASIDKVLMVYHDTVTSYTTSVVGTVSGTAISFGTPVYHSANGTGAFAYHSISATGSGGACFAYSYSSHIYMGYISVSGTVPTVVVTAAAISGAANATYNQVIYNSARSKVVLMSGGTAASVYSTRTILPAFSLTADSQTTIESAASSYFSGCLESTSGNFVGLWRGGSNFGKSSVCRFSQAATTNANNFIGISKSAVTNAAAQVATIGAKVTNQTGLTPGAVYYLSDAGALSTTPNNRKIGKATAATDLIIDTDDVSSGAWVLLSTVTAAGSTTVDIEQTFSDAFDDYVILGSDITVSNNSNILARLKLSGAYSATGYKFNATTDISSSNTTTSISSGQTGETTGMAIGPVGSTTGNGMYFTAFFSSPATSKKQVLRWTYGATYASDIYQGSGAGYNTVAGVCTGIRFASSYGTVNSGTFRLYGIKK